MKKIKKKSKSNSVQADKLNITNALLVIITLLIVMSAIQIFQFQKLTNAIVSDGIKTSAQPINGAINLPSQVGGCGQ